MSKRERGGEGTKKGRYQTAERHLSCATESKENRYRFKLTLFFFVIWEKEREREREEKRRDPLQTFS